MNEFTADHQDEYDDTLVSLLELIWGEGFLSPGGPEALARIVAGLDLKDKLVLDIGCGIGGLDLILARDYGARVIGLDVEAPLVRRARDRVQRAGLSDRIDLHHTHPGPLPIADASIDVVFGKDSWLHIPDRRPFFAEVFRVLKPGGIVAAADWMRSGKPYGKDMEYFFEMEGLTYYLDTQEAYGRLLGECGFESVVMEDITEEFRVEAHREYAAMRGPLKGQMVAAIGVAAWTHFTEDWRALTVVLDKGELRPGRFRAIKPA